jgi:hypothetical protein
VFYRDLSTKCQVDSGPNVRAVGWLGKRNSPFTVGDVDPRFVEKLLEHIQSAWQPFRLMGYHFCGFCRDFEAKGTRNVWIPTASLKYVAPELIIHYIERHNYAPPQEFISAVMECPPQGSPEFFQLLSRFDNCWDAQRAAPPNASLAAGQTSSGDPPSLT